MTNLRHWPAPAKINLFLHVIGRRDDGYHLLQTAFQFLDFSDYLTFDIRDDGVIRRIGNTELPIEDLSVRAARLLQRRSGVSCGVDIRIDKRIPSGAGLGGGSSDAATTLLALNNLWGVGMNLESLAGLATQLGADVPVFVSGRAAFAEGIGNLLTPISPPKACYVIIKPPVSVDTGTIFTDQQLTRDTPVIKIRGFLAGEAHNDLEPVTCRRYPEVGHALDWLRRHAPARMTGSGSAVFAEVPDRSRGEAILADLPNAFTGFVAHGVNQHPLFLELAVADQQCGP
ncbi:MAG: 4-diphosphocytidyl-2-C-methyl-D-erythritol kinase [marine bacterium B5-7]|nr:MAG: 4-diphosphocytidyl-2-C-methyl-D-erythritol kinase [marine bacterium B5-7]